MQRTMIAIALCCTASLAIAEPVFTVDSVSLAPDIGIIQQGPVTEVGKTPGYAARYSMFRGAYPLMTVESDGGLTIHSPSAMLKLAGQNPAQFPCAGKQVGFVVIETGGGKVLIPAYATGPAVSCVQP